MSSEITPDNERYLQQVVETGKYADRSAAVNEAIDLLRQLDHLRRDLQAGLAQADAGQLLGGDDVFRRLEDRARQIDLQVSDDS